jgi:hypothetical protein
LPVAVPIAEIVEVRTTRRTPAAAAACTAMSGPRALTCHTRSIGLDAT